MDELAAFLSIKFHRLHIAEGMDPALALIEGQKSIRDYPRDCDAAMFVELPELKKAIDARIVNQSPTPFQNPVYWASWVMMGV